MFRAFIAIDLDLAHKQKISGLISDLKQANADVKWANEGQLHITLKFLGNIGDIELEQVSGIIKDIAINTKTFAISLSGISVFPDTHRPNVVWVGIDKGADILKFLVDKIGSRLESAGLKKEKREFRAHLTLGRAKSLKNINYLTELIKKTDFRPTDKIEIKNIILFQSTLTPKGAVHTPLAKFKLSC
ncbi:MAG: RNA 2',3'-cyclic phosphodiesterase [Candidatus Omnitrophica bacterium]|nr:RNA 2',3'-cyclic phosphodiesterase [Candidatus Omnitrophota bacterium]